MLPWELADQAAYPGRLYRSLPLAAAKLDVRWLQAKLNEVSGADLVIDGIPGPLTRHALDQVSPAGGERFELIDQATRASFERARRRTGDDPTAIVICPSADVEQETSIGYWTVGYDIAEVYERHGYQVHTPDFRTLRTKGLPPGPVTVLHLNARIHTVGGIPYLDLSGDERSRRLRTRSAGSDLRPRDVAALLRSYPPGAVPLVVLDPPFPGSEADVPWQLLLRNYFAALLFQEAAAPAILAAGLGRSGGLRGVRRLASGLAAAEPLMSVVHAIRAETAGASGAVLAEDLDALAAHATAVFAAPSAVEL
jgi:hypothetical protein